MRIVSLSPAATEVVFALGLGRRLAGVSHDSDWPVEAASKPVVTRPVEADDASPRSMVEGAAERELDPLALADAGPDLVIAPASSEVACPTAGDLRAAVAALGGDVELLTLDPTSVEGILHSISTVGAMTGAEAAALRVVERLRGRLGRLERRVERRREQGRSPVRVVALERLDPPFAAGRWVPEQVRRAGGWELLGREGEPSARSTWAAIRDVDPETLVLMPRGRHLADAVADWAAAPRPPDWADLEAVRRGQVFVVDGSAYFGRPGPRFVDGIALLAEVLDPDGFVETSPLGSWTPV